MASHPNITSSAEAAVEGSIPAPDSAASSPYSSTPAVSTSSAEPTSRGVPAAVTRGGLSRRSSPYEPPDPLPASLAPKKSVSFSKSTPAVLGMAAGKQIAGDEGESSADETTRIIGAERGPRNVYSAVGASSSGVKRDDGDSPSSLRRRNDKKGKGTADEDKHTEPWWSKIAEKYGSVELENKGSVARDHLALERTFLAWLRTSLSFASIGIAITQLFRLNSSLNNAPIDPNHPSLNHLRHVGKPLGATFLGVAILILWIGFHRYFEGQHYIIRGKFPAGRGSIMAVALLAAALTTVSLVVVIVVGGAQLKDLGVRS